MEIDHLVSILASDPHLWAWAKASLAEAMAWFGVMVLMPTVYALVPNI